MTTLITATTDIVSNFDLLALDDEAKRINPATGEDNQYYNIGVFFQLGSRVDQSAYNLEAAKDRFDKADAAAADELERNGNESIQWARLAERAVQAEAHWKNAKMLYDHDVDVFNAITGLTWQSGAKIKGDDYGRKWYAKQKEQRTRRQVLTPAAPTEKDIADRRAEMLARLAS